MTYTYSESLEPEPAQYLAIQQRRWQQTIRHDPQTLVDFSATG